MFEDIKCRPVVSCRECESKEDGHNARLGIQSSPPIVEMFDDNKAQQEEEVDAVKSIYNEDCESELAVLGSKRVFFGINVPLFSCSFADEAFSPTANPCKRSIKRRMR